MYGSQPGTDRPNSLPDVAKIDRFVNSVTGKAHYNIALKGMYHFNVVYQLIRFIGRQWPKDTPDMDLQKYHEEVSIVCDEKENPGLLAWLQITLKPAIPYIASATWPTAGSNIMEIQVHGRSEPADLEAITEALDFPGFVHVGTTGTTLQFALAQKFIDSPEKLALLMRDGQDAVAISLPGHQT